MNWWTLREKTEEAWDEGMELRGGGEVSLLKPLFSGLLNCGNGVNT